MKYFMIQEYSLLILSIVCSEHRDKENSIVLITKTPRK